MKKRTIGLMLLFAVLISLFAGITACAETTTETVKIKKGDTVYNLCLARGYYYDDYKELIMRLNKIDDETKLAKITAGKTVQLPVNKQAADELVKSLGIKSSSKKTKKGFEAFMAGDASKMQQEDTVKYYIVSYALQKDERIADLVKSWGIQFKDYSERILVWNDLSDYNHIPSGRLLLLPTAKFDIAGASGYYTVIEHTVKKNEFAINICKRFGLEYSKALPTLEKFNPKTAFPKISEGQKLYLPVIGAVGAAAQPVASAVPSPVITLNGEVSGYGIVISSGNKLCIRQQDVEGDLNLTVLDGSFPAGYIPKAGDYVYYTYNVSTGALVSLKYFYNAFTMK